MDKKLLQVPAGSDGEADASDEFANMMWEDEMAFQQVQAHPNKIEERGSFYWLLF